MLPLSPKSRSFSPGSLNSLVYKQLLGPPQNPMKNLLAERMRSSRGYKYRKMAVSKNLRGPMLGSSYESYEGSYYFGSISGPPDFWKLPNIEVPRYQVPGTIPK